MNNYENRANKYREMLRDPRWQKKRLEIMDRDRWKCLQCGETGETLNVHHLFYADGCPWATPDFGLRTLCETCHEGASRLTKGCDEYFWSLLCLGDTFRRFGLRDILQFAFLVNELSPKEFDALRESLEQKAAVRA
jgi:hypothetical protein